MLSQKMMVNSFAAHLKKKSAFLKQYSKNHRKRPVMEYVIIKDSILSFSGNQSPIFLKEVTMNCHTIMLARFYGS